jgi:hypothetical protein
MMAALPEMMGLGSRCIPKVPLIARFVPSGAGQWRHPMVSERETKRSKISYLLSPLKSG